MENQEKHIRDLLQRWTTGDITAREEAELLNAAEQDPFLREALAAYQALPGHDHAATLTRLRTKTTTTKVATIRSISRWSAIAASLLLLLAVGWWALDQQSNLDLMPVAMESADAERTTDAAPAVSAREEAISTEREETIDKDNKKEITAAPSIAAKEPPPSISSQPNVALREEASPAAGGLMADQQAAESSEETSFAVEPTGVPPIATERLILADSDAVVLQSKRSAEDNLAYTPPPPPPSPAADIPSPAAPAQNPGYYSKLNDRMLSTNSGVQVPVKGYRIIDGYIRDTEGYPLIGASILEEGSANGTVTDIDGFFSISVSVASETLSVSYTGFETTEINITGKDNLEVALTESSLALDEVVVTGYSAEYRRQADDVIATARPIDGFRALRNELAANTPSNTPKSRIKLKFFVQADGSLTDFTVIRSTSTAQNALAIQLLKEGPAWEITAGTAPVEVVYVVRF